MVIGCIIGTRFALKHRKSDDYVIPLSITTGMIGTLLSAVSFSSFLWIIALLQRASGVSLFSEIILPNVLVAITVGVLIGALIGGYYFFKVQKSSKEQLIDEEFYESLK